MASGAARADDTNHVIRWLVTGVPPKLIPDGPLRGTGYGEQQVAFLTRHLAQFEQHLEVVTPARLWHEMQTGQGVCSVDIADVPDREGWAIFSRHQTSLPNYRMLVAKDRVAEFSDFRDRDGLIDLDRLAASDRFTGIYVAGRHYTPEINRFLDNPSRKTRVDGMSASPRIFEMVASGRGDFSFASITEMNYFNAVNAATQSGGKVRPPLTMMTIKGVAAQVHGHIACSRDPRGRKLVEAVDRLLDEDAMWKAFLAPELHWMEDIPTNG
jgi:uncharacterized protein (TIGR02285 family)